MLLIIDTRKKNAILKKLKKKWAEKNIENRSRVCVVCPRDLWKFICTNEKCIFFKSKYQQQQQQYRQQYRTRCIIAGMMITSRCVCVCVFFIFASVLFYIDTIVFVYLLLDSSRAWIARRPKRRKKFNGNHKICTFNHNLAVWVHIMYNVASRRGYNYELPIPIMGQHEKAASLVRDA